MSFSLFNWNSSSPFSENFFSCRNLDVKDLCYMVSFIGTECVKIIFYVERSITCCRWPLPLLEMCETISHCYVLSMHLTLHFVDPSFVAPLWNLQSISERLHTFVKHNLKCIISVQLRIFLISSFFIIQIPLVICIQWKND